jgi:hypothetical protein
MSAPNLTNVTNITGNTALQAVTTTPTAIVSNSPASNQVFKVDTLICANVDNANVAVITADVFRSSTAFRIAANIQIPPQATLMVVGKDSPIYLQEGDTLRLTAGANGTIEAVASYEVMQ